MRSCSSVCMVPHGNAPKICTAPARTAMICSPGPTERLPLPHAVAPVVFLRDVNPPSKTTKVSFPAVVVPEPYSSTASEWGTIPEPSEYSHEGVVFCSAVCVECANLSRRVRKSIECYPALPVPVATICSGDCAFDMPFSFNSPPFPSISFHTLSSSGRSALVPNHDDRALTKTIAQELRFEPGMRTHHRSCKYPDRAK